MDSSPPSRLPAANSTFLAAEPVGHYSRPDAIRFDPISRPTPAFSQPHQRGGLCLGGYAPIPAQIARELDADGTVIATILLAPAASARKLWLGVTTEEILRAGQKGEQDGGSQGSYGIRRPPRDRQLPRPRSRLPSRRCRSRSAVRYRPPALGTETTKRWRPRAGPRRWR